jgi:hypothetical protein
MRFSVKSLGLVAATAGIAVVGTAGVVMATGGFDNPSANQPPHIVKFGVNGTTHDGPGCGLVWDGDGVTAVVKHDKCLAGNKINGLAAAFPKGRSTYPVWVSEPRSDIDEYGHGPFKGWAKIVGTDAAPPQKYDFILRNVGQGDTALYLSYTAAP